MQDDASFLSSSIGNALLLDKTARLIHLHLLNKNSRQDYPMPGFKKSGCRLFRLSILFQNLKFVTADSHLTVHCQMLLTVRALSCALNMARRTHFGHQGAQGIQVW